MRTGRGTCVKLSDVDTEVEAGAGRKKVMNGIGSEVNDKQRETDREEGAGNILRHVSFFFGRVVAFSCLQSDLLGSL